MNFTKDLDYINDEEFRFYNKACLPRKNTLITVFVFLCQPE